MESDKPATPQYTFERRRHPRLMVELPVEYRRAGASRLRPGHTINFGEDGFMISVSEQMEAGEDLEMKIYFTSSSGLVTIAVVVKVIWEEPMPSRRAITGSGCARSTFRQRIRKL
jgi:hypothetical protein